MAEERDVLRDWHRLFGLLLTDFFTNSPFTVEVERDLSLQQQFLDVVIVRRGRGRFVGRLPDGLTHLVLHNLITFKSHREALDAWAIKELISHYVAYRKLVSSDPGNLLSEDDFRLIAVCARFPQKLSEQVALQRQQEGVYHCQWGTDHVTIVVAGQLPLLPHNAPLHLFSASPELIEFGSETYQQHSALTSSLLRQLFERLSKEGLAMAYTMKDFVRQFVKDHINELTSEDRREFLQDVPPEQRLAGISPEQILAALSPEQILAALPPEQIRQYLERLEAASAASPPKRKRKK